MRFALYRTTLQTASSKMMSVFSNASITLAAAGAIDSSGGLLSTFVPAMRGTGPDDEKIAVRIAHLHSLGRHDLLDNRGWTFQETALSQRIIIFTDRLLYWECSAISASEHGLLDDTKRPNAWRVQSLRNLRPQVADRDQLLHIWTRLAREYSTRKLTYEKDKIPALAGLTTFFQSLLHEEVVVGLWRKSIVEGLLWEVANLPRRFAWIPGIPSWSWLSVTAPIEYDEYLAIPIKWQGALIPTSDRGFYHHHLVGCRLLMIPATFEPEQEKADSDDIPHFRWHNGHFGIDYNPQIRHVYALEVAILEGKENVEKPELAYQDERVALLLLPIDQASMTFRRIGVLAPNEGPNDLLCKLLETAEEATVTIV
ncbi:hypothetical protein EDD36DRAFT_493708 [Exophiala viscosa]|uniref:Heterokaryon incompatibility domain-containing protein n=1 Tax=Exophiala viscosa TaxID=2486360 RepID=A0AAN6DY05_9EURO|nr:hypothetical protein EDD36DRAFT_493708 [Exophiala viscosa]